MAGSEVIRFAPLFLFLLLATGCSHPGQVPVAPANPAAPISRPAWLPRFQVERQVLPNGLTVLFVEDHSVPLVSYTTWVKVGSAWEKKGATGVAHLFEHLMFGGTKRFPGKRFIETLEANGAVVNASTQRDATTYYEVIASQHLETVIDMEADRLMNLELTQKGLDDERRIVKDERRLRVDSNFGSQQMEALLGTAFPTHPYGHPVIGYPKDLDRLTLEGCVNFFRTYYQPGNILIVIAGDVNPGKARGWLDRYYGAIKGRPVPALALPAETAAGKEVAFEQRAPVNQRTVLLGYRMPSMFDEDSEKLEMLAWALFGMSSSRGYMQLVREKQVALAVSAEAAAERYPFLFLVSMDVRTSVTVATAREQLDRVIEDAKDNLLSTEEIDRVKNRLIYAALSQARSPLGMANFLGQGEYYFNDYDRIVRQLEKYAAMTASDLRNVARKYLNADNRVVSILIPEDRK